MSQLFSPKNSIEWIKSVNDDNFTEKAMELFRWQSSQCPVFKEYIELRNINPTKIETLTDIPFLPIEFFKTKKILAKNSIAKLKFESSGTTGQNRSKHFVAQPEIYQHTGLKGFENTFGDIKELPVLALLPSYLERSNASLVYMVKQWVEASNNPDSGFYLNDFKALKEKLKLLSDKNQKGILIGVSFALLDLADDYTCDHSNMIVIETGGMKGRKKEMIREELHQKLKKAFKSNKIYSEYGMTEMLSQAYTKGGLFFYPPPYMKALVRSIYDPFEISKTGSGAINVIDLANIYSCAFLETQDMGTVEKNGSFKANGRLDNSEIRGCNLMLV